MFNFNRLYTLKTSPQWWVQAYCGGMNHIARVTDGTGLNAVKADLGLTILDRVVTGLSGGSQYLHGKDQHGHQFFFAPTGNVQELWLQTMQLGIDTFNDSTGKTFKLFRDWAEALTTSIKTKATNQENIFLSGHGIGGAVMSLVHQFLGRDGWKCQQTYMNAPPCFVTEAGVPSFNGVPQDASSRLAQWSMFFPEDELGNSPPGALMNNAYYGASNPPLAYLYCPGRYLNWRRSFDVRLRLNDCVKVNDPLNWPNDLHPRMWEIHETTYYVRNFREWITNNEGTRNLVKEIFDTLNTNFAMGLPAMDPN